MPWSTPILGDEMHFGIGPTNLAIGEIVDTVFEVGALHTIGTSVKVGVETGALDQLGFLRERTADFASGRRFRHFALLGDSVIG